MRSPENKGINFEKQEFRFFLQVGVVLLFFFFFLKKYQFQVIVRQATAHVPLAKDQHPQYYPLRCNL